MTKVIKNLCIKTHEWEDKKTGEKRAKWLNIGSILQKEDGGKFMLLDRHINLAAFPHKENSTGILISMFDPKDENEEAEKKTLNKTDKFVDDEIPF